MGLEFIPRSVLLFVVQVHIIGLVCVNSPSSQAILPARSHLINKYSSDLSKVKHGNYKMAEVGHKGSSGDNRPEILLEWTDVKYSVHIKDTKNKTEFDKEILHGLSGFANPG